MKWIELHSGNAVTLVNTDHISEIWPNGEQCSIWLDTTDNDAQQHFTIKESYDEVKRLILMDENHGCLQEALDNLHNLVKNNT